MIRWRGILIDRRRRCVEHGGMRVRLPPVLFRYACALLLAGPKSKREIFDIVYGADEGGGPLSAKATVDSHMHRLRKSFAAIGIDVLSDRHLSSGRYWAEPRIGDAGQLRKAA